MSNSQFLARGLDLNRIPTRGKARGEWCQKVRQLGLSPEKLRTLAGQTRNHHRLGEKLRDCALIYDRYAGWLESNGLEDADALLGLAAEQMSLQSAREKLQNGGLWFDGFAQLTPAERDLLVALLPACERATLAFCVDPEQRADSALSPWHLISRNMAGLKTRI